MHRYEELERLYYKKLFFKIFLTLFLVILFIGVIAFIYFKSFKEPKKEAKEIKKPTKIVAKKETKIEVVNFILPEIKENIERNIQNESKKIESKETKKVNKTSKSLIEEKKVDVNYLIEKFKQNPSLDLALMIANEYLKENNLTEARNWALKSNNMNPQDERSWLIFADILIKQGKIKKAREILNFYIDSYGKNDKIENKLRSLNDK